MENRKTVIIKRPKHNISRRNIDEDALKVIRRLNSHGYKAYLVGGSVRDLQLGRSPKDFDVSTDASPNQVKKLFRNCFLVGRRFRLAHIRFGYQKIIETSTFRRQPTPAGDADNPDACLMQRDDNEFGTPEEDARRRDFTINGLFYDLKDFSIIDHVGGMRDLRKGVVRAIGDPNVRFREDPVRMMRAVRFAARLGFRIEPATYKAILSHHAEICKPPAARLIEEVYRLFAFGSAEPSFFLLWKTKLLSVLFPEVDQYLAEAGGEDAAIWRMLAALDSGEHYPNEPSSALMLATLLYEPLRVFLENSGEHANFGEYAASVEEFIAPIAVRFRVPKWVRHRMIRAMTYQHRLDSIAQAAASKAKKRRGPSPTRLAANESFPEARALLELRAAAGTAEPGAVAYWEKIASKVVVEPPKKRTPNRSRYSRKRRPRSRKPKEGNA